MTQFNGSSLRTAANAAQNATGVPVTISVLDFSNNNFRAIGTTTTNAFRRLPTI